MTASYYRKFYWFGIWLLALIGCLCMIPVFSATFNQRISIFHALPDLFKWILIIAMLSYIPGWLILKAKHQEHSQSELVLRWIALIAITIVLIDRLVLNLTSITLDTLELSKNPKGFLVTMIYMAVHSSSIWLNGILGTLKISSLGTVFGFLLAVLLLFLRISEPDRRDGEFRQLLKLIGNTFSKVYVTVIRGTPMMVQALIIYYAGFAIVQSVMVNAFITERTQVWSFFTAGLITVSLNSAAYLSEVLRGGIVALDKGQNEACASLGFTKWQTLMKVTFPQAVRNSIPAICNEFIINIKDTSVLNVIGVTELMFATSSVTGIYYKYLEVYCITAIIYLILTFTMTAVLNALARKLDMPTSHGVPSSN